MNIIREMDNISVFKVYYSENHEQIRLLRVADVKDDGEIILPQIVNHQPKNFNNREKFNRQNGPDRVGYFGIWQWYATHNQNDYERDYYKLKYEPDYEPIRVFRTPSDKQTMDQTAAINMIKNGIKGDQLFNRLLYWNVDPSQQNGKCKALYYPKTAQVLQGEVIKLRPEIIKLPVYDLNFDDFLLVDDTARIYKHIEMPEHTSGYVFVKDRNEIIRDILVAKTTWQTAKFNGYTRATFQSIKNYLENCLPETFLEEIQQKLECNESDAKSYYNTFMQKANSYVDGETFDDETLISLIDRSESLNKKVNSIAEKHWVETHEDVINRYNSEMEKAKKDLEETNSKKKRIDAELEQKKVELKDAESNIDQVNELAAEVETEMQNRINHAKDHMAEFISNTIFLKSMIPSSSQISLTGAPAQVVTAAVPAFRPGNQIDSDPDENSDWKDELSTIENELQAVGVAQEFAAGLAALLYSCFLQHFPVLLAGPGAKQIADAFSVSLNCCMPAVIDCSEGISSRNFENINDNVVVIKNVFLPACRDIILSEIREHDNFFILTTPVSDELVIEPTGILNYVFPVITEFYLTAKAPEKLVGGIRRNEFRVFQNVEKTKFQYASVLQEMHLSEYSLSIIKKLVHYAKAMNLKLKNCFDYQFCLVPLAIMRNEKDIVLEKVRDDQNLSVKEKELIEAWLGE